MTWYWIFFKSLYRQREFFSHISILDSKASGKPSLNKGKAPAKKNQKKKKVDSKSNITESSDISDLKIEKSAKKKKSKAEILDAFIRNNPSISKIDKEAEPDTTDYSNKAGEMPLELATETLARIYEDQGNIKAAKKIYTALMLKFPTKKPYFADRIKKLK